MDVVGFVVELASSKRICSICLDVVSVIFASFIRCLGSSVLFGELFLDKQPVISWDFISAFLSVKRHIAAASFNSR